MFWSSPVVLLCQRVGLMVLAVVLVLVLVSEVRSFFQPGE